MKSSTDSSREPVSQRAKYVIYGLLTGALLLGIGCLVASWVPYDSIYEMLQRQYGSVLVARRLSREFYEQKQHLIRIIGFLSLLVGGLVYWRRPLLGRLLTAEMDYLHRGWRRSRMRLRFAARHVEASEIFDVLLVTAVGLIDRIVFLAQPARFDEVVCYLDYASKPLYLLLSVYTEPENHIFNTLLVHFSTGIFGGHLWAIRLPALCAGTLMVPLVYFACRQLYGRLPAIVASSLVATSSVLLEYSTNGRGYMIVGCCFLLLLLCGALIQRKTEPLLFLVLAVAAAVGFYAIPIMLFPAGAIVLWLVFSAWTRRGAYLRPVWKLAAATVLLAGLLTIVLYSPVFVVSGVKAVVANPYVTKLGFRSFVEKNENYLQNTWQLWNRDLPPWATLLVLLGFVLSVVLPFKALNQQRRLIGATCLWCLVALAVFRFAPFPRVWLFLLPLYLLSAATGWIYLGQLLSPRWTGWPRLWRIAAFALLVVFSFRALSRRERLDSGETGACKNAEQVANFLMQNQIPIQQLVRPPVCNMPLVYYYQQKSGRPLQEIRFLPVVDAKPGADGAGAGSGQDATVYWVFVNSSQGDSLGSVLHRDNLEGVTLLSKVDYDGGYLCQIRLER
jgi:4-amino-4-deoxy-L-arabinose transferase-like glycosyltransferase